MQSILGVTGPQQNVVLVVKSATSCFRSKALWNSAQHKCMEPYLPAYLILKSNGFKWTYLFRAFCHILELNFEYALNMEMHCLPW